ncbi:MAG: acetyl/propionyl/methylcrotonyl-CoA carboxylase subunit alpha [Sphingobium sp.]|jgi:3-methylcrotonyl-CoA carboxylase alpha subunit|uniref:acetyl/propionyl/methylcrotonyl-CoA carboxylase subunit alpha n=1 Tax=Sphingobium sp. TaxID=1912891 RepID=UPI000C3A47D8|nr:acetyl/propionyl/methylcrotonyl-CoA carboxylase subunit alpha [Sphingobium sp.]MBU0660112.1 acetyl/propionyl/methylcrotonyl-CoA carboxylase subunit alpha [Alphaproteobacteria bacterium]MBA4756484.1 acetyl/propionyl/methylcrotonyl-CoA carboxylase subunit alpha [Sphingobium sp.]MBS87873.1 methylcrotonoyl-CoA carboxylase [Sphingobium sp.]MBU0775140.1 acetyl/propionyl/methylcrotonyl-CoA carboxylase subunit alpha [Alphaproteobacteria bacterium]MBU0866562.1 acetyl/propionyl/methylcrotonyl-CoA car
MIQSLLIANRGEIACRIIRTARAMGIRTVAVYSDADAQALHVRSADEAVHIGPAPVRESYLLGDRIIAAALQTGAQAIHPGYGFLSENAEFAQAVIDAGLIWVGPNPSSITAMGLKDAAKQLMQDAGVPTTPGYLGADQSPAHLAAQADAIGYPVLIKAVAGGGGKGMRKVDSPADFADALASCQREAASSFGNDHVLLEKWVTNPRHIEVQVFGDTHGNVVHLFERDCSLQRRHQKVIEEAPAPGMDAATREAICQAAVRAAKAVDYVGAGTIEFIADGSEGLRADRIWFMEMNTRLQVEHPVTEEITGVDLVEWQLRVASGEPLPLAQDQLSINGHAMEARLYAEDPIKGFLPSIGRLDTFEIGEGCRIDTGVEQGAEISPFYDPMIAKVIAHGSSRNDAREALATALDDTAIWPLKTNAGFLVKALDHPDFIAARLDTGLIAREGDALMPPHHPDAYALADAAAALTQGGMLAGFRLNAPVRAEAPFLLDGEMVTIGFDPRGGEGDPVHEDVLIAQAGQVWRLAPWRASGGAGGSASDGAILSPMPGRIISVSVAAGDAVAKGQKLLTLEAMKMEHSLIAPFDGTVAELNASEGGQVSEGVLLAKIETAEG